MQTIRQTHNERKMELLDVLDGCVRSCNNCISKDLLEPDLSMMIRCIQLDLDCSDICNLTSHYLSRESEFTGDLLKQCATICDVCAEECEKHSDMPHCVECGEICRKCAEVCRDFRIGKQ